MRRCCPICRHTDTTLKRVSEKNGIAYRIVRCDACGFVFVSDSSETTYVNHESAPQHVPVRARHRQIKRLCDDLLRDNCERGPRRIVEIGSGWGGLAHIFTGDVRYSYLGFEPSADRARFCARAGISIRAQLFEPSAISSEADVVVLDNVLEHVSEPTQLLSEAARVLAHGGILIAIVPNLHDIRQLVPQWRERHHWQPHCHINYFTAHHLGNVFADNGLEMRFFYPQFPRAREDWKALIRATIDSVGFHLMGLNCYAVKA